MKQVEEMTLQELQDEVMYWRDVSLQLNDDACSVKWANFTVQQHRALLVLWNNRGRIVTRRSLQDHTYEPNIYVDDRSVDSLIKRLRIKLRGRRWPGRIYTSNGRGYYMKEDAPHPLERGKA